MKKIIILCLLWTAAFPLKAQWKLSEEARISILTSAPYNEEVFTVFGHAAFRVHDPVYNYDVVFNYGIFDFSRPDFILRFALGKTDYILGTTQYAGYIAEYRMRGSDVTEQVLGLTEDDKNALYAALMSNALPENRTYRYNFFFDNCATRLPAMIESAIEGEIIYYNPPPQYTFRRLVHDCTGKHRWLTFGIDLALGSDTDRDATAHEMMFLPEYVKQELAQATVFTPDGQEQPLISDTFVLKAAVTDDEELPLWDTVFTPQVCGWVLFLSVTLLTVWGFKKKKTFRAIDIVLFSIAGMAGCVLFFLCFISEHPCIWPNWSVVWLHPFHLAGVLLFSLKKVKKAAYYYHLINFATLLLLLAGWFVIPQQMNAAFIPLVAILALRSGWNVFCDKKDI